MKPDFVTKAVVSLTFLIICPQTLAAQTQAADKPAPGFTLTLAESKDTYSGASLSDAAQVLRATYTNTKNAVDPIETCAAGGAFYLEVVYNGVNVTKNYPQRTGIRGAFPCAGIPVAMVLQPGESKDAWVLYDTTKPGKYEFTVVQDSDPKNPAKNVTVRSNTVTIVAK